MRVAQVPLRSSYPAPRAMDAEAIKRRGYLDQGILVINVADPRLRWHERELLRQIADRFFGPRAA